MQAKVFPPDYKSLGAAGIPTTVSGLDVEAGPDNRRSQSKPLLQSHSPAIKSTLKSRRVKLALLTVRATADGLLLVSAFVLAHWLRYGLELGRDVTSPDSNLTLSAFYLYIGSYLITTLVAFQKRGLYALPRGASWLNHTGIIAGASLIGVSAVTLGTLLFNTLLPSRLLFVYLWICTVFIFALERFFYRRIRAWFWKRDINIRRALVVGAGIAAQRIMKDMAERTDLGYKLVGYLADDIHSTGHADWQVPIKRRIGSSLHRLGAITDIERVITQQNPQEVIVALPATHHAQTLSIMECCRAQGIEVKLVPDLFEMRFNEVRIDALNGVPLIGIKDVALQGVNLVLKRILDVTLALIVLVIMALPLLAIAIAVKLSSPGPVLFKQQRVGKAGRTFTCFKFRSMYKDAEARLEELRHLNEVDGPIFKMKNDPRLTRLGKVLRSTSLDELPQLYNILLGDMSWVGPRPPTPSEVTQYNDWHHKRLDTTSGLTGLWQVSGRSDLSFDEMVKLDLYYAENWSLALDLMILIRTIPAVLQRSGAY